MKLKVWKLSLTILFVFFALHFLKDMTQDILHIQTPLDYLGNINEDLTILSSPLQRIFEVLAYISYGLELVLLFVLFRAIRIKEISIYDRWAFFGITAMGILFLLFAFTDPRLSHIFFLK